MPDRLLKWVQFILAVGGTIAAVSFAYATLNAQVQLKAETSEVEALRQTLQRIDERTQRIERYLCRGRPNDIGC